MRFAAILFIGTLFTGILTGAAAPAPELDDVKFRFPSPGRYRLEHQRAGELWIEGRPSRGGTNTFEFGSRLVVQANSGERLKALLAGRNLRLARTVGTNIFIFQAPDARTAVREAHRLASDRDVTAAYPVFRRPVDLSGSYALRPTDSLFYIQWPLEHRNADGSSGGVDLNTRAAWPYTRGEGVTIAVADSGIELEHPELVARTAGAPHYNFAGDAENVGPINSGTEGAHGTEAAGLAAASLNNNRMAGVAPGAGVASWVVLRTNYPYPLATDEQLADMFVYRSELPLVQNHSWASVGLGQIGQSLLEDVAISNAVSFGRQGRGVVIVRAAGNDRASGGNANDDSFPSDPRVICVAAVRIDGRVTSYSEPGACVLVAAPSGDLNAGFDGLFTTDLSGLIGVNRIGFFPPNEDMSSYVWAGLGFTGTSAAAPQISGVAALILSANPDLSYRDAQQILLLSSRHFHFEDPDVTTNGAGFLVSHNVGFGVPDAGVAVRTALSWTNRPALETVTLTSSNAAAIPDDGLRVVVTGEGIPAKLASISSLPSVGPHADDPTAALPLVDFGFGTNTAGFNLTNKAALIQRGGGTFAKTITAAAQAGAKFAVVYNYLTNTSGVGGRGGEVLVPMAATEFVPIPAVFIRHSDGEELKALVQTNVSALAQIHLNATSYVFAVTNTLLCEHVGVRILTDHQMRGDLRITLVSPAGTRSVLQRYNLDSAPGPVDWTYYSTHHFYESSAGNWTVYLSDQYATNTGNALLVALKLTGVPIVDGDRDGLDDNWETTLLGGLNRGPKDDLDADGYINSREQVMGTHPMVANNATFAADLSPWDPQLARLSWPSSPHFNYEVWQGVTPDALSLATVVPGQFPETEWFTPYAGMTEFFRIRAVPKP
jgi:subtilisin family serine protease/subtilisin-like proprotein convertase family protein